MHSAMPRLTLDFERFQDTFPWGPKKSVPEPHDQGLALGILQPEANR